MWKFQVDEERADTHHDHDSPTFSSPEPIKCLVSLTIFSPFSQICLSFTSDQLVMIRLLRGDYLSGKCVDGSGYSPGKVKLVARG